MRGSYSPGLGPACIGAFKRFLADEFPFPFPFFPTRPLDSAVHRAHNRCRLPVEYPIRVVVDDVCDFETRRGILFIGAIRAARVLVLLLQWHSLVAWAASEVPYISATAILKRFLLLRFLDCHR